MINKSMALFTLLVSLITVMATLSSAAVEAAAGEPELFVDSGQLLGTTFSYAIALGDVDDDTDLDAFIGKNGANEVWLNDGNAVFTNSGQFLGTSLSYGLALGDLDGDDDLDAFIANRGSFGGAPDKVWLNDGQGHFHVTAQSLGNTSSYDVALGDVNMDGVLDAFVAACGDSLAPPDNENTLWLNDGNASFNDSGLQFGTLCSAAVTMGDLNHDNKMDIVVANAGSPNPPLPSRGVEIWLNLTAAPSATVVFSKTQVIDLTYNFDVGLGDLNHDTHPDIFIANGDALGGIQPNHIWINDGMGYFTDSGHLLGSAASQSVALGDFNLDGFLDAAVGNGSYQQGLPDTVWFNDAGFTFTAENLGASYTLGIAAGDLDGDVDLDLFMAMDSADQVWVNQLDIAFSRSIFLPLVHR